jgi:hypothetical protein
MPYFRATDQPVYWAVGNPVVASSLTEAGGLTLTGLTLYSNTDENTFLSAVLGKGGTYNPLPAQGGWCEAGIIYSYGGDLVICRQSHVRTEHVPSSIPALFATHQVGGGVLQWVVGEWVNVGARRLYETVLYQCLQAHQTQSDQAPSAPGILGVLWGVVPTANEWAIGVLYHVNDQVTHVGVLYKCLQQHTSISTWSPDSPGILNVLWAYV